MDDTLQHIDLLNYQVVDFLDKENYSLIFYKCFTGIDNEEYLNGFDDKEYYIGLHDLKVERIKMAWAHQKFILYPFKPLKYLMWSISELENNILSQRQFHEIESIKELLTGSLQLHKLVIEKSENFAILKNELLKLQLSSNRENASEIPLLRNNLKFIKEYKTYNQNNIPDSIRYDYYQAPQEKSFLNYLNEFLSLEFTTCKNQFNQELLFAQRDYDYFDEVLKHLLEDYKIFQKLLYKEKGYFVPAIKEFQSHYIQLFKWLLSDFSFYLDRKHKKELEQEVAPRNYLNTFDIVYTNRIYQKQRFKKFANALIQLGYIDEADTERLKQLFGNNRSVDGLINWTQNIGTLYTFIKILSDKGIIKSKNIWEITARYIKVQDKIITTKQLRDSKFSQNSNRVKELQKIADIL